MPPPTAFSQRPSNVGYLGYPSYPYHAFRIGCGIHCGDAVLGNIGADSRRDFTTLGDSVNVTFRIESLCSGLNRPVLVSEEIKTQAGPEFAFDDPGPQSLKGKPEPMNIYALRLADG